MRSQRTDFFNGMRTNMAGLDARLTPDLDDSAISTFLTGRKVAQRIAVRYTIGMLDTLDSVREAIRAKYRFFKIKLCGDPEKDRVRLSETSRRCLATATITPPSTPTNSTGVLAI